MNAADFANMRRCYDGELRLEAHDLFRQLGVKPHKVAQAVAWHLPRRFEELTDYGPVPHRWNYSRRRVDYYLTQCQAVLVACWVRTPRGRAVVRHVVDLSVGSGAIAEAFLRAGGAR